MKRLLFLVCAAALITACSQKQSLVTSVPPSQIDVEKLIDSIDYNMDVSGLSLADVRTLRHAPAAQRGLPFMDSYLRGIYSATTWYDSLMWVFDEKVETAGLSSKEDESWRDFYFRVIEEKNLLNYNDQEKAFIKRMEARETELKKQNFEVPEGLRVNMTNLLNPSQIKEFDQQLSQQLSEDGFAIVPALNAQLFQVYEQNDYNEFPNFVTTDLYLQLYHLYIDCMLRELEMYQLFPMMVDYSYEMLQEMKKIYQRTENGTELERAAAHSVRFFTIAETLLRGMKYFDPGNDEIIAEEVEKAVKAVDGPSNFMADYKEVTFAYSLFRPRGHYTRNHVLEEYFRGMMWLQSVPFGMDHEDEINAAVMIACVMKDNKSVRDKYEKFDRLITYLMGKPDNLSIQQVIAEVEKAGLPMEELLKNKQAMSKLKKNLENIGNEQTRIRPKFEKTSHNKICIMPQRYQPDAEVLQEMVDYDNKPTLRATPKGLDFMAAMGVTAAEKILMEEKTDWKDLGKNLKLMKKRMGEIDWNENIATQWMQTLKIMTDKDKGGKLPYFMQNPEWSKKDLNAALASWAELKHDAILYAKQPMGAECGGGGPPEPVVKGYVEPNVAFWKKAIELLDNTEKLLKSQNLLTEKISDATERMRDEAKFLLQLSEKELAGEEPSEEEYDQLKYIGASFENISLDLLREPKQILSGWTDVQGVDRKVAIVADVYTANADNNPNKSILFEAVGDADEIYVVVEIGGYLYLTRGAVLSYREFIQPIDQPRKTDEEWQKELESNPRKGVPEWMKRIIVPLNKMPEPNEEVFYSSGC
ncbi:Protein of unknown function [Prevotella sp. ne3005]|uniref:DUF3160 domain-containing protein n=1 Tax=Prevotella sp. ne3005 TaxID=1761887 RepID=UPI0008C50461|nr:DUF3160 domain-containing protein [Prevotella sp. ne3005]SEM49086.1 Protein of unknown function [Prevotella sp. ne3005]